MKKQRNTLLVLLMTLTMILTSLPNVAKADLASEQVIDIYSGSVNGVERTLVSTLTDSGIIKTYLKVGNADFKEICDFGTKAVIDENGIIWIIQDNDNHTLMAWSYDLDPNMDPVSYMGYDSEVESFIIEGSGSQAIAVGYKYFSGEIYSFPSFKVIKEIMGADPSFPEPHYIPSSETPTLPTPETTQTPVPESPGQGGNTATPEPTTPIQNNGDDVEPVTTVKKSGNSVEVTEDGEVISKVTFNKKKGIATFKVKNKNKKVKKVKQAFIIGDSYNYGYITKTNKFKTINRKTGKTKTYSGKWKKATIKKNVAVNVVKLGGNKKKKITGF